MKHVNYLSFFLLTLFSISFISCSDDDDNKLNTGITNQSWTEGKSLEISQDNELSVSFNAAAKWVASVTSGADWCKLNTTSGTKGQSTLKLSVSTSSTTDRTARISINIVTECFPFDEYSLVMKVMDKMFALIDLESANKICLKCDPEYALELREHYAAIEGAYHFNKKYWNQVFLDGDVDDKLLKQLIDHSMEEVLKKFTKKMRTEYEALP